MPNPPASAASPLVIPNRFWSPDQLTFSVPVAGSIWGYGGEPNAPGYKVLTAAQAQRFVTAMQAWDRLIAPNFFQTNDLTQPGNIRVAFTDYEEIDGAWGYAFTPPVNGSGFAAQFGDIWINADEYIYTFPAGSYEYASLLHEIGHALGLRHPHDAGGQFPAEWDDGLYTVMSYHDKAYGFRQLSFILEGTQVRPEITEVFQYTPMVLDIAAIQERYGADPATAAGNDVYTFDQNQAFVMAIYDAGGIDTIDISNHTRGSIIDLTPGAYSSIAKFTIADQIAYWQSYYSAAPQFHSAIATQLSNPNNHVHTWTDNLGIAFNTVIENVIGSQAADDITGNAASNFLEGRGGDDIIRGGDGDDFVIGGLGNDLMDGGEGTDTITFDHNFSEGGVTPFYIAYFIGGTGLDLILRFEVLNFADGTIDVRDSHRLIDDLFYYGTYKDIWVAKADADVHYAFFGWKEGRDPNHLFDTKGYMAAYGDEVLAANLDPLTHYLTIGWKKGYDPSTQFDTSMYLAAYADVAAAGVNPLEHYFLTGQYEGRQAFDDGSFLT